MNMTARIRGTLVGPIWWPVGAVCTKDVDYDVYAAEARTLQGSMSLRDHLLSITNDGDMQHAELGDGVLEITTEKRVGSAVVRRTRTFDLKLFPSIADMLTDEVPCFEQAA
jgi:hypothetical protein